MNKLFYKKFEDTHRGSRELIKYRLLDAYLPVIEILENHDQDLSAIDLGCGRGEWLEILAERKISVTGVDLNKDMIEECLKSDLNVVHGNAISFLEKIPSESQTLVTSFHMVEHISIDDLLLLVKEANRVLKPGGVLILETPNSENIYVGISSFYSDPTHKRPLPIILLLFIVEYIGFHRFSAMRLHANVDKNKSELSLKDVIFNSSMDYSIVAQKKASSRELRKTQKMFDSTNSLSLEELATAYDNQIKKDIIVAKDIAIQAKDIAIQAKDNLDIINKELNAIYTSYSWKISKPLRCIESTAKKIKRLKIVEYVKNLLK